MPRKPRVRKTAKDYRDDNISAARLIIKGRAFYEVNEPLTLQWAEEVLRKAGAPEVKSDKPAETDERRAKIAATMRLFEPFDGRAAGAGKDE